MTDLKVRCADCGYLALRLADSRELVDADLAFRETGAIPSFPHDRIVGRIAPKELRAQDPPRLYEPTPLCFARVPEFRAATTVAQRNWLPVIQADRTCDDFTEWKQGLTPKEHVEAKALEEQREFQRKEADLQRGWQERESTKAEERHREQIRLYESELAQSRRQHLVSIVVFGVLVTAVTVAAQIAATIIQRK